MDTKDRLNKLSAVMNKTVRARVEEVEYVNMTTGEVEKFELRLEKQRNRKPAQKATEPFVMVNRNMTTQKLTLTEKALFYSLVEYIDWEDNFVRDETGEYMSISKLSELLDYNIKSLRKDLQSLQDKKLLTIVEINKREKRIYLYSRFVWFGKESNRNDNALEKVICAKNENDTYINKENAVLPHSNHNSLGQKQPSHWVENNLVNEEIVEDVVEASEAPLLSASEDECNNINKENSDLGHHNHTPLGQNLPSHWVADNLVNVELGESEKATLWKEVINQASAGNYETAQSFLEMINDKTYTNRFNAIFK